MRLMEVDEAANHIKDLVDPDANIIWGSAFNNDLEGKIRVSVVATGIDVEAVSQPAPAKVFAFPTAVRTSEPSRMEAPVPLMQAQMPPVAEPTPQVAPEMAEEPAPPAPAADEAGPGELELTEQSQDDGELLLDASAMVEPTEVSAMPEEDQEQPPVAGTRSWVAEEEVPSVPRREGGTLFERMSQFARGAAKAQVEDEGQAAPARDPLDIPRFLNRQNNQ
jgi:cell division protein FtsZ